jgi:PAS domain S-box-containing protein
VDSLNKVAEISLDNNDKMTLHCASEALVMSKKIKYTEGQTNALYNLSKYYLKNKVYVKMLDMYFNIIDIYERQHDYPNLITAYSRVAAFFFNIIKDYDLARKYIQAMAKVAHKASTPGIHGQVNLCRAQYYLARGQCDSAILNLYQCIPYFHKAHDKVLEGVVYKYLGDAFMQKDMYSLATYNYKLALSFLDPGINPDEVAVLYTRMAHIYQVLENHALNLEFNLAALHIREKTGRPFFISSSCLNVGEAYWFLGRKDSARYYLQRSLQLADSNDLTTLQEAIYSQLSDFAKSEGRYADALKYYMSYVEYNTRKNQDRNKSDILILEANRTIMESEARNDLLNQEMLIQGLQIRKSRFQIFLFEVVFIVLLSLILVVYTLALKNKKRRNELAELNLRLTQEISERIEAEGRLNRSEELHRFLAENTADVISLMDANMKRLYISPSCEKFYGYSAWEILQMNSPLELVDPSFHVAVNQHIIEMFRSKKSICYIYRVLRKDGTTFWAESNINPIVNPSGNEVINIITVVRDVSERVKHEQELSENSRQKEYLLHEIHNRVKNNFAILVSLMNMQRDQSANPELNSSLNDLQLRVRTMSLVHEQLYQSQEINTIPFDNYLHHLALIISSSFNNSRIRMETEICPCNVAIEIALPLGLIINELITNAYKYAFPGNMTGKILVKLVRETTDKFSIYISDNGIGLPPDFTMNSTQSMGSQIVGILVEQIEGSLTVTGDGGACFRILFSIAQEK